MRLNKHVKSKRYHDGVRAAALKSLDRAARYMRDTLRDDDEHQGNSTIGSDSCNDEPAYAVEDGTPTASFVPSPWEIHVSEREPGVVFTSTPSPARRLGHIRGPGMLP